MEPETPSSIDYNRVLEDLEAKRSDMLAKISELDAAIAAVKRILGHADILTITFAPNSPPAPDPNIGSGLKPSNGQPEEIPEDCFFAMTAVEATKKYLRMVKRKKSTKEIAEALQRGGFAYESKNFYVSLWNILNRERKNEGSDILKIKTSWGLADWYPDRRKTT